MNETALLPNLIAIYENFALSAGLASFLARGSILLAALLLGIGSHLLIRRLVIRLLESLASKSRTRLDDILFEERVFTHIAFIAPIMFIYIGVELAYVDSAELRSLLHRVVMSVLVVTVVAIIGRILNAAVRMSAKINALRDQPVKSYAQVIKIVVSLLGAIVVVSILLNQSPWALISGLGALTAVLMLVFRDSILGFVASIQIAANDMVKVGDWIEMPKFGADGDVIDISLTTIKVQNWDKTITTIPSYALTSDSFKNWRGMMRSQGRRIKRSIKIDISSVRFLEQDDLAFLKRLKLLSNYLPQRIEEVEKYNEKGDFDQEVRANGRRLTNLGTFRAYLQAYLEKHPMVNQNMTLLVRQLPPGDQGVPIELYFFCSDKRWAEYEAIQADIFDHIFAVVPEFDLQIFQSPSGSDFRQLKAAS